MSTKLVDNVTIASSVSSMVNARRSTETQGPDWLALVQRQVESLKFGVVQVVVHNSQVVQIEKTERVRLPENGPGQPTEARTASPEERGNAPYRPRSSNG